MAKIQNISVISIPVTDQQAAKAFYLDQLGFVLRAEAPMGDGNTWVQLAPTEDSQTSITLVHWFPEMQPGSLTGNVLATDDIEGMVAELRAKGVEVGKIDETPWGRFAGFKDPDGNGWMLHEITAH